jgi:hypothetical protein
MIFATLDQIIRRTLLEKGYPIHWYAEYMFHASAAIRELSKDTLKIIRSARLPVNSYYAVDLPDDFVDDLAVTLPVGNLLQNVPKKDSITPLRLHDTASGAFVPYSDSSDDSEGETVFGFVPSSQWFWNVNDFGEPTGRYFGAGGGANANGYKVFKERRQIQLTESFTSDEIVLLYISSGQSADNATQVEWLAFSAIQAFINWKRSRNADIDQSPEGVSWYNQRRLLRANLNDMTTTDIKQILRKNYTASIKS